MGLLRFSVAVDGMVVLGCEIVGVGLMDFEIMVLKLDSYFGDCFYLELGDVREWTSGGVASMVDVTGGFLWFAGVGDVSWLKSHVSMSSISSMFSSITFVIEEGS